MAPSKKQRIAATANIKCYIHDLVRDFFGGDAARADTHLSALGHQQSPVRTNTEPGFRQP